MTNQTLGRNAETAMQDIQKFMEGYKPLRHRLYSFTEKYQRGFLDAPGTKGLAATSAVAVLAAVASIAVAASSATVSPIALPLFALAGAAQAGMGINYLGGKLIHAISKSLTRSKFEPEQYAQRIEALVNARIQLNDSIPEADKVEATRQVMGQVMHDTKALFTDELRFGDHISTENQGKLDKVEQSLDKMVDTAMDTRLDTLRKAMGAATTQQPPVAEVHSTPRMGPR